MKSALSTFAVCAVLAAHARAQAESEPHLFPSTPTSDSLVAATTDAPAAARAPSITKELVTGTFDEVLFSQPGDGALWTRGNAYKARFDGRGATVIPFFGSDAPRDYPLELHVSSATIGGHELAWTNAGLPTRADDHVSIDHGAFVESWDLELDRLEQRFVFDSRPGEGDLVVHVSAESELTRSVLGASLRFENELGRVEYGDAFAVDTAGRRIGLERTLEDGAIVLRVPSEFVRTAAFPLTIDPFVTFFTVAGFSHNEFDSEVAYDVTSDKWCVVWIDQFSTTDFDVFARLVTGAGTLLPGTLTIDYTTDYWTTPHIANNNQANIFLVVCAVVPSPVQTSVASIRGQRVDPVAQAVVGGQFQISPLDGAYRNSPDVGGDPNVAPYSAPYFCVVWQRYVSPNNLDIEMQLVDTAGGLHGALQPIDNSIEFDEYPRISKSLGRAAIAQPYAWHVVWQRRVTSSQHDIYGAEILWHGQIYYPTFPIDTSSEDDTFPVPSTIVDPLPTYEERPYMVVYQRAYTDTDVIASVLRGRTLLFTTDLSGTYPGNYGNYNQTFPTVDCDGEHFLVGHVEQEAYPSTDTNVWISDYYLSGNGLASCGTHQVFAGSPVAEGDIALCSMGACGGPRQHFFGTWWYASINNQLDVQGGLWDSCAGGTVTPFCFGDGTGTACPCGNSGGSGRGCATSLNPLGAQLTATGQATMSADTFTLSVNGAGPGSPCLYFQGTLFAGSNQGLPFGDGLRCVAGTVIRLGVVQTDVSGNSSFNGGPSSNISILGGLPQTGGTRMYQGWFRDAHLFCTSSTFNLTNALEVRWGW